MATTDARIQVRRDTAANWTSNNPTLSAGEIGFEPDNGEFKIGDGTTAWTSLSYAAHNPDDYPSDTAWTTTTSLDNGWTGTVKYIKRAGWVTVSIDADGSSKTDGIMLTLASGYRSPVNLEGSLQTDDNRFLIGSDGSIQSSSSQTTVRGTITYPVL